MLVTVGIFVNTVEPPLTDTSRKQIPPISRHQTVVPAISLLKLYIFNLLKNFTVITNLQEFCMDESKT